ncbi:MAG: N-6 DNA methylase [Kofleriaceae bacterium]
MSHPFATIRSEGGLLPPDLLARIAQGDRTVPGLTSAAYRLDDSQQFGEAISRSWNRMLPMWHAFRAELAKLPFDDPATVLTREKLLQPLLQELGYGRVAPLKKAITVDDREYAISHAWGDVPIHLLGAGTSLEERTAGQKGAAKSSPHGLVQDLLNRSEPHLWALLSNGLVLRLLRDHHSLTTQAYVEVDLEALFDGERYSDFALMWLVFHQSRIEPQEEKIDRCWLEQWFALSRTEGLQALDDLRDGVIAAIEALGRGFLKHAHNTQLSDDLKEGVLDRQDYYRELLRLVYRLIFLFSAEDRGVLLDPNATEAARDRYRAFYATRRLRDLAGQTRGGPHGDLWQALRAVMNGLDDGCPPLALPALGSFLWSKEAVPHLDRCELANTDLLAAIRALSYVERHKQRFPVSWRTVAADELGSVYESLLELHPKLDPFELITAAGNERKKTGSYYTPTSLVDCLLDSALAPVIDSAIKGKSRADAEAALLALKVVDPACGSGHFLVAAARRLARRLATVRTGDDESSPRELQHALRDVVGHCIYGVDLNEMAVELCKVALWMEAVEPGKPLSFLDAHVQHGNALIGATPALIARGIPDDAWDPIEGDDKKVAKALKKRNRDFRKVAEKQTDMLGVVASPGGSDFASAARDALAGGDDVVDDVRARKRRWEALQSSSAFRSAMRVADTWCAAFVWPKLEGALAAEAPTWETFERVRQDPGSASKPLGREVRKLAGQYLFFHWHLAFPDVFQSRDSAGADDVLGWDGGFDCVLGNPPWEHVELKETEWFSARRPEIAKAENAAKRKKLIAALEEDDPALFAAFGEAGRALEGEAEFSRRGGRYPLAARGRINTYALFAELNRTLMSSLGRVGCIVPSGIATDDTTKDFFADLVSSNELVSLFHFENEEFIFPTVHHAFRFCLLTLGRGLRGVPIQMVFYARQVAHLGERDRQIEMTAADFLALNPNTKTCATFRWRRDAEINRAIYQRLPVLWEEGRSDGNLWGLSFMQGLFNMASDSGMFIDHERCETDGYRLVGNIFNGNSGRRLPLYEAKMIHHFDHRFATYEGQTEAQARQGKCPELDDDGHADAAKVPLPYYWVDELEVQERLGDRAPSWLLGWRRICRSTDLRTLIASAVPATASGDSLFLMLGAAAHRSLMPFLAANLSSLIVDYTVRQKIGGTNLSYFILKQVPVLGPASYVERCQWDSERKVFEWLRPVVLELIFTAQDMEPFARELGFNGPPFRWDRNRRSLLRAELDAAFFHLYGVSRADADYILDTFPVLRDKETREHGEYRTKRLVLERYDALANAIATRTAYVSPVEITWWAKSRSTKPAFAVLASASGSSGAWATPDGADNINTTLLVLTEVLRLTPDFVDAQRVRWAVLLAQRPALASPLLSGELREKWQRLVGVEATPRPADVADLDQFRKAPDRTFANYVKQLKSSKHLVVEGDHWRGASNLPVSRVEWLSGRAATAVEIAKRLDLATASEVVASYVAKAAAG